MRLIVSSLSIVGLFLTSCAYQGVIVQKQSRPHPLYDSIGIDGVYSFLLRDGGGTIHRQMVSPEVFETYAEGQYFNDQQPPAAGREFKETQRIAEQQTTQRASQTAAAPVRAATSRRVSAAPPPIETSQSFRASELQRSSRSMTATLRTEVHGDTPPESDGMKPAAETASASAEHAATSDSAKEKTAKKPRKVTHSTRAKSKPAAAKSQKPWRMTEPTVETNGTPAPPSEGPAEIHPTPSAPEAAPAEQSAPPHDDNDVVYVPPPPK